MKVLKFSSCPLNWNLLWARSHICFVRYLFPVAYFCLKHRNEKKNEKTYEERRKEGEKEGWEEGREEAKKEKERGETGLTRNREVDVGSYKGLWSCARNLGFISKASHWGGKVTQLIIFVS